MLGFVDKIEVVRLRAPVAAGVTDVTDSSPLAGAHAEVFVFGVAFGAIVAGAATSIEIHGSDASGGTYALLKDQDGNDVKVTVADTYDNQIVLVEVVRPRVDSLRNQVAVLPCNFLKPVVKRATQNATIDLIFGCRMNLRTIPCTQPSTVALTKRFVAPYIP